MKMKKVCKMCGIERSIELFHDTSGFVNSRGYFCRECVISEMNVKEDMYRRSAHEGAVILIYGVQLARKNDWVDFIFGGTYWSYQYVFERECLYCGVPWGGHLDEKSGNITFTRFDCEHMDPKFLGGVDYSRNIAFSCSACNSKKGKSKYIDWIEKVDPNRRAQVLDYYIKRQNRHPQEFKANTMAAKTSCSYLGVIQDKRILKIQESYNSSEVEFRMLLDEAKNLIKKFPWED